MKAKIRFVKGTKTISIHDGNKYVGSINIKDFNEFINNKEIDIMEFIKY
ncbi:MULTISPECIES: hypothetical protein [Clostridium]|uniref:Uncharacterized protein n=1 Tax=Clostridium carnis TaxID=1530 RepID=A0ABY6ST94_9CLOT|nr:hypothetical protein [Clostridium carnis]CAI3661963.1 hypothetical protein CNEO3_530019 [Clostridium neonatale]CAI3662526.1 hypothetical protein CNEO3_720019 [Clostridium neonatale]CAI3682769.1 hypothetical protein CNEO3_580019 [Clostridium neonatale]CAI3694223.1 hypothetical protein CNEO3_570019 [Clostridium neonatale]CAI3706708.1 hypothetical protein CNEO3_810019 [Clostridium neonatale]